jgi:hypothetical protein
MINISTHPSLADLHQLIDAVPTYPINAKDLANFAMEHNYPSEVVDFYKLFPDDQVFFDKSDIVSRTELIELLETENQPYEDVSDFTVSHLS